MKKLFLAALLCTIHSLYALPFSNPSEASFFYPKIECPDEPCCYPHFRFGIGFYGDYVFNRHMKTIHGKGIDTTKRFTNAAYLVLNFHQRVDLFSTLGSTRLAANTSLGAFNVADPHPLFELETQSAFSFSAGARATLFECRCFTLGIAGQYFSTQPNVKRLYIASGAVSYPSNQLKTHYSEWQIGAGLSYRYNPYFIPYAAIKYEPAFWRLNNGNRFIIEDNTGSFLHNLRNHKHVGYAIGLTLYPCADQKLSVTAEGRFANEKAFYINGQMRF